VLAVQLSLLGIPLPHLAHHGLRNGTVEHIAPNRPSTSHELAVTLLSRRPVIGYHADWVGGARLAQVLFSLLSGMRQHRFWISLRCVCHDAALTTVHMA